MAKEKSKKLTEKDVPFQIGKKGGAAKKAAKQIRSRQSRLDRIEAAAVAGQRAAQFSDEHQ